MEEFSVAGLVGKTPLFPLGLENRNKLYLKMENFAPSGSIKDRVFKTALDHYEKAGVLHPGMTLTIASSGNAAISLVVLGRNRGYRVDCYMPTSTSSERRHILTLLGAGTYYVDGGMQACQTAAKKAGAEPGSFFVDQFSDPVMLQAHEDTAAEIAAELPALDVFVTGVGSGVTLRALGTRLKKIYPGLKTLAFEPEEAPGLSKGIFGPHGLEGVGPNFPSPNYVQNPADRVVQVSKNEAYTKALSLIRRGLLVGITTASAVVAAEKSGLTDSVMLAVCYDGYEKYLEVLGSYEK